MVGTTISHYKVIEKIDQGVMLEVYRAEDTNLSREVAIKVLPEQFTKDPSDSHYLNERLDGHRLWVICHINAVHLIRPAWLRVSYSEGFLPPLVGFPTPMYVCKYCCLRSNRLLRLKAILAHFLPANPWGIGP